MATAERIGRIVEGPGRTRMLVALAPHEGPFSVETLLPVVNGDRKAVESALGVWAEEGLVAQSPEGALELTAEGRSFAKTWAEIANKVEQEYQMDILRRILRASTSDGHLSWVDAGTASRLADPDLLHAVETLEERGLARLDVPRGASAPTGIVLTEKGMKARAAILHADELHRLRQELDIELGRLLPGPGRWEPEPPPEGFLSRLFRWRRRGST